MQHGARRKNDRKMDVTLLDLPPVQQQQAICKERETSNSTSDVILPSSPRVTQEKSSSEYPI